jgi:hypothetical protein
MFQLAQCLQAAHRRIPQRHARTLLRIHHPPWDELSESPFLDLVALKPTTPEHMTIPDGTAELRVQLVVNGDYALIAGISWGSLR